MKTGALILLAAVLFISTSACRESTRTISYNSTEANRNASNTASPPANSGMTNQNSDHTNMMNSNTTMNHNTATMSEDDDEADTMNMKSSPNAADQPFDLQFIDSMTQHHQGAVVMAKMVLAKSQNQELRKFAEQVISDQEKEIEQMEGFRDTWFVDEPEAINLEMPGMGESMHMMMGERMDRMESSTGQNFDMQFLDMMAAHHAGAVTMSKLGVEKIQHQELKTLAQGILQKQEKELKQMQMWKEQWAKRG